MDLQAGAHTLIPFLHPSEGLVLDKNLIYPGGNQRKFSADSCSTVCCFATSTMVGFLVEIHQLTG